MAGAARARVRIGVVSDTHLPRFGTRLPDALVHGLRSAAVERILHLGDLTSLLAVGLLAEIAPVDAVAGNNDGPEIIERYGRRKIVTLGGVRIGMVHGDGIGLTTLERARHAFLADTVEVVCFGHSHAPYAERHDGVLYLNPGSPTDRRREPRYSYAVLDVASGQALAELRYFDDRSYA